jgi:glycosyltransferase involved in cell wall biosynthesis
MTLATFVPFLRRDLSFGPADHFGKVVAHHDLLKACLRYNVVSSAVIFICSTLPRFVARERALQEAALKENPEGSGNHRITLAPLEALPQIASTGDLQFLSGGVETIRVAQLRSSLPGSFLPITTLVHAVAGWPDLLPAYLALVAACEPYDTIVATSVAAEAAVKRLLDMAARSLGSNQRTGAPQPEVVRIPLAAEDDLFEALPKDYCRKLLGLDQTDFVVLSVGRVSEEYKADLEPLLVAFKRLTESAANAALVLAGQDAEGLYAPVVRACAQALGVQDRVRIVENFPFALKRVLYGAADMFVSAVDSIQESFGIAVVEAMGSGLAVVASDWSGYRDIVVHGETGFLVPSYWDETAAAVASVLAPVDAPLGTSYQLARRTVIDTELLARYLLLVYTKPEMRMEMGKCGAARARANYSWPVVIRRYEEMWKQARSRRPANGATTRIPCTLNLNALFGHYAAARLDPAMRVRCTERGRDLLSARHENGSSRLPETARKRAAGILERCRKRPVKIGELIRDSLDPSWKDVVSVLKRETHPRGLLDKERGEGWQLVVHLLKKGYLAFADSVERAGDP